MNTKLTQVIISLCKCDVGCVRQKNKHNPKLLHSETQQPMCVKLPLYNLTDATVQSSERECIPHVKLLVLVDCPLSSCLKVTSD